VIEGYGVVTGVKEFLGHVQKAAVLLLASVTPALAVNVDFKTAGVDESLRASIELASLSRKAEREEVTDPAELIAAARADYSRILGAMYDGGYFAPKISILVDGREASDLSPFTRATEVRRIIITVEPGPTFRFSQAQITPLAPDTKLADSFRTGDLATTSGIREAAQTALDAWRSEGHAKAAIVGQDITANHSDNTISVSVSIVPGPKLRFGRIASDPDSAVTERRQRYITGLRRGTTYDPAELALAEERLRRTGVFQSAVIVEADEPVGSELPLRIEVTDRKPRRFGFGAEISTLDGGRLSAFWLHRNFRGGAERVRVDAELGGIGGSADETDAKLALTVTRPATLDEDMDATVRASVEQLQEPTFESQLVELSFGLLRRERPDLDSTAELGLRYDESIENGVETTYRHAIIAFGGTWDRRDDALNPTEGTFATAELKSFIGLGDSDTGLRGETDLRAYASVTDSTVLAARARAGAIWGASIAGTPPDFLFLSGGGGSVRGQAFQSLGVPAEDPDSGGLSWVGLSGEVRNNFTDALGGVLFVDAGYVAPEADLADGEWHGGAGVGVRYNTPIGPIRLDLAVPIEGTTEGVSLYLGIGQAF